MCVSVHKQWGGRVGKGGSYLRAVSMYHHRKQSEMLLSDGQLK